MWRDWRWQVQNAITDNFTFERLLGVSFGRDERLALEETVSRFPLRITPYYLSLIDAKDIWNAPIFMQCFPSPAELQAEPDDMEDPLAEDADHPAPCITHRYPDRVLFLVSNVCAMYLPALHPEAEGRGYRLHPVGGRDHREPRLDLGEPPGPGRPHLRGDSFMLPDNFLD